MYQFEEWMRIKLIWMWKFHLLWIHMMAKDHYKTREGVVPGNRSLQWPSRPESWPCPCPGHRNSTSTCNWHEDGYAACRRNRLHHAALDADTGKRMGTHSDTLKVYSELSGGAARWKRIKRNTSDIKRSTLWNVCLAILSLLHLDNHVHRRNCHMLLSSFASDFENCLVCYRNMHNLRQGNWYFMGRMHFLFA